MNDLVASRRSGNDVSTMILEALYAGLKRGGS